MIPAGVAQWDRVQSIFHATADLPAAAQPQAVLELCPNDPALAQTVLDMLQEDRRHAPLLDSGVAQLAQAVLRGDSVDALLEHTIASYRLIRLLGEGGTGVVYLAEHPELGRTVAIKLLRHAWLSPMRRQRFAIEQQMLGQLNHPGIARIYDAGTLTDGTPWFVMEYIDGLPLTPFLTRRAGTIRQDLQLFRHLCAAVRYAHSHAIVHRDLKPSNILITAQGEPRLIDFGIAKQLLPDLEADRAEQQAHPDRTLEGLAMMTPAYAAPEQRAGGDIGVFTDIYALGVILYEILTDTLPKPGPSQLPAPPSTLAPARASLPGRHWHDLDLLTLTALAPEPKARYRSVDALLYDLDAYLEDRPLLARPPSRREALLKFTRRHRTPLTAITAAVLLFLVASTVFTVRLARARNAALAETARVTRLQHFTEGLFDGGDSDTGPNADLRVTDLLKRGETEAATLDQDPRLQADMLSTVGVAYQKIGQLEKADSLLQRSLEERRQRLGPETPEVAQALLALGLLRKDQRRTDQSEALLTEAAQHARAAHDDATQERALIGLASTFMLHGKYDPSQQALAQAAILSSRGKDATLQDELLTEQANLAFYQGDYDHARPLYQQALALGRHLYGNNNPKIAQKLNGLGNLEKHLENLTQAESILREALAIDSAWYGPDHPDVAADLLALSEIYVARKQYDQAEAMIRRVLAIQQHTYGEQHSRVAEAWNQLGVLAYIRDRDDEAETAFRKALAIYLAVYGPHQQSVGIAYANLVGVYLDRKDYPNAELYARKSLTVYAATLPPDSLNPASVHVRLGRILKREGRYAEAAPESLKGLRAYLAHNVQASSSYIIAARKDLAEDTPHIIDPQLLTQIATATQPAPAH